MFEKSKNKREEAEDCPLLKISLSLGPFTASFAFGSFLLRE